MKKLLLLMAMLLYLKSIGSQEIKLKIEPVLKKEQVFVINKDKYLGIPYLYGGENQRGIDCSALIQQIFQDNNIKIPRNSRMQYDYLQHKVHLDSLKRGDLLFFKTMQGRKVSHVAIYLGNKKILHATKSNGVSIDSFSGNNWKYYWKDKLVGCKNISLL
jgi:cell wall-associated NlpC family hydrolase